MGNQSIVNSILKLIRYIFIYIYIYNYATIQPTLYILNIPMRVIIIQYYTTKMFSSISAIFSLFQLNYNYKNNLGFFDIFRGFGKNLILRRIFKTSLGTRPALPRLLKATPTVYVQFYRETKFSLLNSTHSN